MAQADDLRSCGLSVKPDEMVLMPSDHERMIQDSYARRVEYYDRQKTRTWASDHSFSSTILNYIVASLSGCRDSMILDVGAGNGWTFIPLL
jgi:hypothetical protein